MRLKQECLRTEEIIKIASEAIQTSGTDKVVIDPVMVCKGEDEVLNPGNTTAMIKYLLPYATVVTPNFSKQVNLPEQAHQKRLRK